MYLALMKKELLALSRDTHGLAALFLMPMVFIVVMSLALQDVYSPSNKTLVYAIENLDKSKASEKLISLWEKEGKGDRLPWSDHWREDLRSGRLKYVLRIDAGFAKADKRGTDKASAKVHLLTEPGLDNGVFESLRMRLLSLVMQQRAEGALAKLPPQIKPKLDLGESSVSAERLSAGPRPSAVQQNVPAWLVFGMFFVVASIAGLFVEERGCGALARLKSYGVASWQLILSKTLPYFAVNGIQAVLMLSVGVWLMPLIGGEGLSLDGVNWPALVLMLAAISVAAVSLALAVACLVRTHAQAATLGPILNVLMAALGGVMVPVFVMPPVMQAVVRYSPMNWGLEGLLEVLLRGGNAASIIEPVATLCGFGGLMLLFAYGLLRRSR